MNILFVSRFAGPAGGGVSEVLRELALRLHAAGHRPGLAALAEPHPAAIQAAWQPVSVTFLRPLLPALGLAPEGLPALERFAPDVIHTHGLWLWLSRQARVAARRLRRPHLASPHGMLDPWALRHSAAKKRLAAFLFERDHLASAACIHVLNTAELEAVRAWGLDNPAALIPNGVSAPPPPAPAADPPPTPTWKEGLPPGGRVLLFLGRLHPKKGLPAFLAAWQAAAQATRGWTLAIAGWDDGGHEAFLRAEVDRLGLGAAVRFLGSQVGPAKWATLRAADAFVLPSLSEGQPMAVLEAWSCGLPVLMTRACNLPEGFEAGAAAEFPPGEADAQAASLASFLQAAPAAHTALASAGRALVAARFSWDAVTARYIRLYEWVLNPVGPAPDFVHRI